VRKTIGETLKLSCAQQFTTYYILRYPQKYIKKVLLDISQLLQFNYQGGYAMKNESPQKKKRLVTSITFDEETLAYLDDVSKREERNRSAMVRTLIKEHKRTHSTV